MDIRQAQSLTSLASRLSNSSLVSLPTYEYEIIEESDENLDSKSVLIFNVDGEDVKLELHKPKKKKRQWSGYKKRFKIKYVQKKKVQGKRPLKPSKFPAIQNCFKSKERIESECTWRWNRVKNACLKCLSKFLNRIWNLHVDSLIVPAYRQEWGAYRDWSYKYMNLPVQDPVKLKRQARRMRFKEQYEKFHHDPKDCQLIRINVSGKVYCTQRKVLENYPDTLLGNPHRRKRYYDPCHNEYFFDRHRTCFEPILHYYQSGGGLYRPKDISTDTFVEELKFYGLGSHVIHRFLEQEGIQKEEPQILPVNLYQRKIWCLMEYRDSSNLAQFLSIISLCAIIFSTGVFCIDTLEIFEDAYTTFPHGVQDVFIFAELVCLEWFTLEYVLRFAFSPNKWKFLWRPSNVIDFLALLPYIIVTVLRFTEAEDHEHSGEKKTKNLKLQDYLLRYFGMVRVLRVLKISRYSKGLQVLGKTLVASVNELSVLVIFLTIGVIILSSATYFAEANEPNTQFHSIPDAFWWGIQVLTTLGMGDKVPVGAIGRIIASIAAVAGVLILAFPVPVIATKFNLFYSREISSQQRAGTEKPKRIPQCPNLPSCPIVEAQLKKLKKKFPDKDQQDVRFQGPKDKIHHHRKRVPKKLNEKRTVKIGPTTMPKPLVRVKPTQAVTMIQEPQNISSSSEDVWYDAEE